MKKKLIIGNWKMNPPKAALARGHFLTIKKNMGAYKNVSAVIAAPFVYIPELAKLASAGLSVGAQNVSSEKEGAFTGEISAAMLADSKVKYVIVGHSERRALGETNALINKKLKMTLQKNITPILSVGEKERDGGMWYLSAVKTQLEECLQGIPKAALSKIVIMYEPVWAISTSENHKDATPHDFEEMRIYIQKILHDVFGVTNKEAVRIIYGGSVNEKNAEGFLRAGADGLLPGKASLSPKSFITIIKIANEIR